MGVPLARLARLACNAAPLVLVACGSSASAPAMPADAGADASAESPAPDSSFADGVAGAAAEESSLSVVDATVGPADAGTPPDGASADSGADAAPPPQDSGADVSPPPEDAGLDAAIPLPALPLQTSSRWIVDANGKRFKLASVNWYGAEEEDFVVGGLDFEDVHAIARMIRGLGFNSVRLPFSNELVESNPVVADARLAANSSLQGSTALQVLDAVIAALGEEGLVVILDDHMSNANWCCSETDENGLWFNRRYSEEIYVRHWEFMAERHRTRPNVIAAELRNELRYSCGNVDDNGDTVCLYADARHGRATAAPPFS